MSAQPFTDFIGKSSPAVKNEVEKGAIRKFADAIGDPNPDYRDGQSAGPIVAPPTFSRTFEYGRIPEFELPFDGLIHGEQMFEYFRPIVAGDVLYCTTTLLDVKQKSGKLGNMVILTMEHKASDEEGQPVVREVSTIIYRGAEG